MLRRIHQLALTAALVLAPVCFALAQEPALLVRGEAIAPKKLALEDLRKLPQLNIRATPEHRKPADYACVALGAVLTGTGASPEKTLRGKRMSEYLLVRATDGYQAVFALPELDAEFSDKAVLLCYLKDGAALPADEGPLRLVVPDEKRQARWVRQVTEISVEKQP